MPRTLRYFAWVAELVGTDSEQRVFADDATVADAIAELAGEGGGYAAAFADLARLRFALDGEMALAHAPLGKAGELAIFPPVTGG